MTTYKINRTDLDQYGMMKALIIELDDNIREVREEIEELNQYNINVGPVYTGMPTGNEKRDKIAEYVIKLEDERSRLGLALIALIEERNAIKLRLREVRASVNRIPIKQLRELIIWHFFDELSINEIADKAHLSTNAVYKRIEKFFK